MPNRIPWNSRTFRFDFPVDLFPEIVERARGLPARAEDLVRGVAARVLTRREPPPRDATWSIQENLGHLADLDGLFMGRLDDYEAGAAVVRAADMSNRATLEAEHNGRPIGEVLARLRRGRERIAARLEAMEPAMFARVAVHPRLKVPMRLVDCVWFQAEHDDYHLARVRELVRLFG